jgi:hypothetical protein
MKKSDLRAPVKCRDDVACRGGNTPENWI